MAKKPEKPESVELKDNPKVKALAVCVWFAVQSFPNKVVFDKSTHKMEGWHAWFRRALTDAGYEVPELTSSK